MTTFFVQRETRGALISKKFFSNTGSYQETRGELESISGIWTAFSFLARSVVRDYRRLVVKVRRKKVDQASCIDNERGGN